MDKLFIGIDPGVNTGLAVWNKTKKSYTLLVTTKVHKAMDIVRALNGSDNNNKIELVVVEDARKRGTAPGTGAAKAQGAGSVKRDCSIWEDFLHDMELPYLLTKPKNTKWDEKRFALVTGYKGRTSNHARDAALLVHGK